VATLSGIYFLFLPSGGYQGGRNPWYGVIVLFSRHTWEAIHTWSGMLMIGAAIVHLAIHWRWVGMMAGRTLRSLLSRRSLLTRKAAGNLILDAALALSLLLAAASGVYFLFVPTGGFQGGRNLGWDPGVLFSRTTWDLLHTWSSVALIGVAVGHFWIHWRWVKNVAARLLASPAARSRPKPAPPQPLTQ
jgi:hypothetical protein